MKVVNICLHDVTIDKEKIRSVYDVSLRQLQSLCGSLAKLKQKKEIDDYHLFFDDGYSSILTAINSADFGVSESNIHSGIITDKIGQPKQLDSSEIIKLERSGFSIESHGVSHSALAKFNDKDVLLPTRKGGEYRNSPYGKLSELRCEQVKYQLIESENKLRGLLNNRPLSFILPYGIYNKETLVIATAYTGYRRLYTCDSALDAGQYLAPRLLVTQLNIDDICREIRQLSDLSETLIERTT